MRRDGPLFASLSSQHGDLEFDRSRHHLYQEMAEYVDVDRPAIGVVAINAFDDATGYHHQSRACNPMSGLDQKVGLVKSLPKVFVQRHMLSLLLFLLGELDAVTFQL
jgi:hypothetical protein